MKVFITGASGFVGGAIANALKDEHDVFGMARSDSSAKKVSVVGAAAVMYSLEHIGPVQAK